MVKFSQTHPKPLIKLTWHSILLSLIHIAEIPVDKEKEDGEFWLFQTPLGLMRSKDSQKILDAVLVFNLP